MKIFLPDKNLLQRTGSVDYYYWNYKFPIKYVTLFRYKKIVQLLGNKKYNNLLEIGTGSGVFLPELSKHCDNLYASDIHGNFGNIKKMMDHYEIKNYDLQNQDILKTDYPDNFFDAIIATSVLEFVGNLNSALIEIKRILKDDGLFFTTCPMENKFADFILSLYAENKPSQDFGNSRTLTTIELEKNFRILKKGYMIPLIGKFFPVYTYYELSK